jgi:AraC family transcriptional regulator, transcriptional activator FtrA
LSPRTYLRHFVRATGTTPGKWSIAQRVQAALTMLESGDSPAEEIAVAARFAAPVTLRHHFGKLLHTSPSAYRRTFRERRAG